MQEVHTLIQIFFLFAPSSCTYGVFYKQKTYNYHACNKTIWGTRWQTKEQNPIFGLTGGENWYSELKVTMKKHDPLMKT